MKNTFDVGYYLRNNKKLFTYTININDFKNRDYVSLTEIEELIRKELGMSFSEFHRKFATCINLYGLSNWFYDHHVEL